MTAARRTHHCAGLTPEERAAILVKDWGSYPRGIPPGQIVHAIRAAIEDDRAADTAVNAEQRRYRQRVQDVEREFIRALCGDRLDGDTAVVFADWLEDHGRTGPGHRVRLLRPQPQDWLIGYYPGFRPEIKEVVAGFVEDLANRLGLAVFIVIPDNRLEIVSSPQARADLIADAGRAAVSVERDECEGRIRRIPDWHTRLYDALLERVVAAVHGGREEPVRPPRQDPA